MISRRTIILSLVLPIFAFFLSGCMSLLGTFDSMQLAKDSYVYIGVKSDVELLAEPWQHYKLGQGGEDFGVYLFLCPFFLADIPLSFVMDTALLPYTIPKTNRIQARKAANKSEDTDVKRESN